MGFLPRGHYGWDSFRHDLIAGCTVAAIAVPQSMAYALIAGVDPQIGLYTAIVMTALGSIFGSSSHLINGPTNAISLVVFSALAHIDPDAPRQAIEATFFLALYVGAVQIAIALFKLGDLTRYISESVVLGFMAGAGCLVALTQIGNLLGVEERGTGHQHLLIRLWLTLREGGAINPHAVGIGVGTAFLVVLLRRIFRKYHLPRGDMLLVLVLASGLVALCGWEQPGADHKQIVATVGAVPRNLPLPRMPEIRLEWLRDMGGSALAIAMLGLLEALAIAKSISSRTREPLDYNRQCLAEGLANLGGGFFQCMPGSGSLTRSAINFQAGAVSRLSGVFAAIAVAVVVLLLAPLARYVPKPALAGILLVTAAGLIDWTRLRYAIRATRYDAGLVYATAFAAVFISIEFSILIGTFLSFLFFVPRAARLSANELVVSPERLLRERRPDDPKCTKLVLLDLEGEFFFGAAPELDTYLDDLRKRTKEGARILILRVKRVRNPDVVCMERLEQFIEEMQKYKIVVLLCGVREDFARAMKNLRFHHWLAADRVFLDEITAGSATLKAVRHAYELLGDDLCPTCPRRGAEKPPEESLHYSI